MIENQSENVKLTFEQLQQLDTFQKRLDNLKHESDTALRTLSVTKNDLDRLGKDKAYQESLLKEVTENVVKSTAEYTNLLAQIEDSKVTIARNNEEADKIAHKHVAKAQELSEKESSLTESISKHNEDKNMFNSQYEAFSKDKEVVNKAKIALSNAIGLVTWK